MRSDLIRQDTGTYFTFKLCLVRWCEGESPATLPLNYALLGGVKASPLVEHNRAWQEEEETVTTTPAKRRPLKEDRERLQLSTSSPLPPTSPDVIPKTPTQVKPRFSSSYQVTEKLKRYLTPTWVTTYLYNVQVELLLACTMCSSCYFSHFESSDWNDSSQFY